MARLSRETQYRDLSALGLLADRVRGVHDGFSEADATLTGMSDSDFGRKLAHDAVAGFASEGKKKKDALQDYTESLCQQLENTCAFYQEVESNRVAEFTGFGEGSPPAVAGDV